MPGGNPGFFNIIRLKKTMIDLALINKSIEKVATLEISQFSVISEMNVKDHWTKKRKRRIMQDEVIRWHWKAQGLHNTVQCNKPYYIAFTRISSRYLDDDNLKGAFKSVRDSIADLLIPGKRRGVTDSSPLLTWIYDQEKGPKGIRIEIYRKS